MAESFLLSIKSREVKVKVAIASARSRRAGNASDLKTKFYIYVLRSIGHDRYYIGHTADLQKRLSEHNSGKTKSTKAYRPWEIIYTEEFSTKSEASKREMKIKSFKSGNEFKKLFYPESWQSG